MYTEKSLLILQNHLNCKSPVSLFLDATGSVIRKMDSMAKHPYYYALSLGGNFFFFVSKDLLTLLFLGDGKGKASLPVAEFISTAHSVEHVQSWLNGFFLQLIKYVNYYLNFS